MGNICSRKKKKIHKKHPFQGNLLMRNTDVVHMCSCSLALLTSDRRIRFSHGFSLRNGWKCASRTHIVVTTSYKIRSRCKRVMDDKAPGLICQNRLKLSKTNNFSLWPLLFNTNAYTVNVVNEIRNTEVFRIFHTRTPVWCVNKWYHSNEATYSFFYPK